MNKTIRLFLVSIWLMSSTIAAAANYVVSGAGSTEVNGVYVETGTYNGKPIYAKGEYRLGYYSDDEIWVIVDGDDNDNIEDSDYRYYENSTTSDTPPFDDWDSYDGDSPYPTVEIEGKSLSYSLKTFIESNVNDGNIPTLVTITHNNFAGETFTGTNDEDFVSTGKVIVSNVPVGLTASVVRKSNLTLEFKLNGNATNHTNVNDLSDLTLTFQNSAFTGGAATEVSSSNLNNLNVDFIQIYNIASSGGDYTTIQDAINAADDFDIIALAAEIFTEQLMIEKTLTIKGKGAKLSIIQAAATPNTASERVITSENRNLSIILEDLTIQNGSISAGSYGGGIYVEGKLYVNKCEILNNKNIAQYVSVGGGIYAGFLDIKDSYIAGNTVESINGSNAEGGGISSNNLTMTNCTVTNNSSIGTNGGSAGGGIISYNFTITNSTIKGNTAYKGGGLCSQVGTIKNCILWGNTATTGNDLYIQNGETTNVYNSIIGNESASQPSPGVRESVTSADPLLNPAANNGGPTFTMALQIGSSAINAGITGTDIPTTDQRGVYANGIRDIGAYEFDGMPIAGAGTVGAPYQIATLADLRYLSEHATLWASGLYFIQTADIDASSTSTLNSDGAGGYYGFSPIGNESTEFQANYDGQNHSISGLYINRPLTDYIGLFGYVINETLNVNLTNCSISGNGYVGALAGYFRGTVSNCSSTGSVAGFSANVGGLIGSIGFGTFTNSFSASTVTVTGNNSGYSGGFAGYIQDATINKCYSTSNVSGVYSVGGFVGHIRVDEEPLNITNCYATGTIIGADEVGGFIAYSESGTVSNCYSGSVVSLSALVPAPKNSNSSKIVSKTIGTKNGFVGFYQLGTITNCYFDADIDGIAVTVSGTNNNGATGKKTAEMKTLATFTDWDFATTPVWSIDVNRNYGYPYLAWQTIPITAPEVQASEVLVSLVHNNDMTISWTNGNGAARLVFVKEGTGAISNPVNQSTYTANSEWATPGTQLGTSGYYCVYNGSGNTVKVTSLAKNTEYSIQAFEYNGGEGAQEYCTIVGANNPISQTTSNESEAGFNAANASQLGVYPNPAKDRAILQLGSSISGNVQVNIFDLSGKLQLVQQQIATDANSSILLNLSGLKAGYYQLQIIGTRKTETLRLLKE